MAANKQAAQQKKTTEIINNSWITPGLKVWVKIQETELLKEVFVIGTAVSVQGDKVKLKYEQGESGPQEVLGDIVYQMNDYSKQPEGYEDMVDMENLSEAELLYNIRKRYDKDQIFTNIGPTLLVINPSKGVPHLYTSEILTLYQNAAFDLNFDSRNYKPHVFSISAETMSALFKTQKNQAIVISGESGAGKTENTKSAMKLLTSISNQKAGDNSAKSNADEPSIETRIIACNPILEAFGNAKTVRNDNSSRFGKYVSLLVDKTNKKIVGATITNYLLEKSRVCQQSVGERNYHIFYILCKGATIEKLTELGLTTNGKMDMTVFEYLKKAECYDVPTFNDIENYKDVTDAFRTMNFAISEQNAIWALVASSLLLGNLDFDGKLQTTEIPCSLINEEYLQKVSELLTLDYEEIKKALLYRSLVIQGKQYHIPRNRDQCITARDSLAKELFNKMFNWLVKRLNFTIIPEEDKKPGANREAIEKNRLHIGLLDIFGFEKFKINSFEQLCINYTNEKLQQLYISYVFKAEEKEFINEGLQEYLTELNFIDNTAVIELMDASGTGIFSLLDDVCKVTKETISDEPFFQKITKSHAKHPKFTMPKMSRDVFTIIHTAKDVDYSVVGFVFKNLDELGDNVNDAIIHSKQGAVVKIYKGITGDNEEPQEEAKGKGKNDKYLGAKFRTQMADLMAELLSCECHFIRCLKANEEKKANLFRAGLTLMQIRYLGVLDSIKVRKDGYPIRQSYNAFYEKYQSLDPDHIKADYRAHLKLGSNFRDLSMKVSNSVMAQIKLSNKLVIFGKTKIFYKVEAMAEFDKLKAIKMKIKNDAAIKIQKSWKRYRSRKYVGNFKKAFYKLRKAVIKIKTRVKNRKICKPYILQLKKKKRAIRKIQRKWKVIFQQRQEKRLGKMVRKIQSFARMVIKRCKFLRMKKAQIKIGKCWKGYVARKFLKRYKMLRSITKEIIEIAAEKLVRKFKDKAAITIQRHVRGFLTRKRRAREVAKIKNRRIELARTKAATKIQKTFRGYLVRKIFRRLHRAATYIQNFFRMKLLSKKFQKIRVAVRTIQRGVRKWLNKKRIVNERLKEFAPDENVNFQERKNHEQLTLLANMIHESPQKLSKKPYFSLANNLTSNKICQGFASKVHEDTTKVNKSLYNSGCSVPKTTILNGTSQNIQQDTLSMNSFIKHVPPKETGSSSLKKRFNIFIKIFDVDILYDLSEIYDELWSYTALSLQSLCYQANKSEIQNIQVGESHSMLASDRNQVFTWGWNDYNQLGRPKEENAIGEKPDLIDLDTNTHIPIQIATGNNHNVMLDIDNNLFVWGNNQYGQLGLGHKRPTDGISILKFLPKNEKIIDIAVKSDLNVAITTAGRAFAWPIKSKFGETFMNPVELNISERASIMTASCGHNFIVLLSSKGNLYTFGDNSEGQLGHGDNITRSQPEIINTFMKNNEKIGNIACGFKHVICKSLSGKVYTWGWGKKGQLGHKSLKNQFIPKQVIFDPQLNVIKCLQVNAGFRHSIALMDDTHKRLYWWGTNSELKEQSTPIRLELAKKGPDVADNDVYPIKIICSWSKSMSITYAVVADTKQVELVPAAKTKIIKSLITKIQEEFATNLLTLPYIEGIAKYFPSRNMKNLTSCSKRELVRESKTLKREANIIDKQNTHEVYVLDGANYKKILVKEKDIKSGMSDDNMSAYSSAQKGGLSIAKNNNQIDAIAYASSTSQSKKDETVIRNTVVPMSKDINNLNYDIPDLFSYDRNKDHRDPESDFFTNNDSAMKINKLNHYENLYKLKRELSEVEEEDGEEAAAYDPAPSANYKLSNKIKTEDTIIKDTIKIDELSKQKHYKEESQPNQIENKKVNKLDTIPNQNTTLPSMQQYLSIPGKKPENHVEEQDKKTLSQTKTKTPVITKKEDSIKTPVIIKKEDPIVTKTDGSKKETNIGKGSRKVDNGVSSLFTLRPSLIKMDKQDKAKSIIGVNNGQKSDKKPLTETNRKSQALNRSINEEERNQAKEKNKQQNGNHRSSGNQKISARKSNLTNQNNMDIEDPDISSEDHSDDE